MDNVFIEGLEVDTVIGVYDWEREIRQCLRLDLVCAWDNRRPAAGDDLNLALDYAALAERIQPSPPRRATNWWKRSPSSWLPC